MAFFYSSGLASSNPAAIIVSSPFVCHVRKAREEQAAQLNLDLKAILAEARHRQKDSGHRLMSFASKPKDPG